MNTNCQQVDHVLSILSAEGNFVDNVSKWTKVKMVIHMHNPLTSNLKEKIQLEMNKLTYHKTEKTPFYPSHESFFCAECNIAIEFPVK